LTIATLPLGKGENLNLAKAAPGLKKVAVELSWEPSVSPGTKFDLDASAMVLKGNKLLDKDQVIYYGLNKNPDGSFSNADGSVVHSGDSLDGAADGPDEVLTIDLQKLEALGADKVVFPVTIHEAATRNQTFGQVTDAVIMFRDADTGTKLAESVPLSDDVPTAQALLFGELYKDSNGEWRAKVQGAALPGTLADIAQTYGYGS
jgi:tellurium resistance protein TerD